MTTDLSALARILASANVSAGIDGGAPMAAWAEALQQAKKTSPAIYFYLAAQYDALHELGPDKTGGQADRIERLLAELSTGSIRAVAGWLDDDGDQAGDDDDGNQLDDDYSADDFDDAGDWTIPDPFDDADQMQFATGGDKPAKGGGEHWVTIGAHTGEGGKNSGGVPVLIRGGKIVGGPARLKGKTLSSFGKGKQPDSKLDHAVRSAAKEHRLPRGDLRDAVHFVHSEKLRTHTERENAKASARKATGLTAGDISRLSNSGHDYTSGKKAGGATGEKLRHFDAVAQEVAREHPELGLGDADAKENFAANLWNVLAEGKREPLAKHHPEVIDEAVKLLKSSRPMKKADKQRYEEMAAIPFSLSAGSRHDLPGGRGRLPRLLEH